MLSLNDCIHFSELTPAEVDALAEHEHIDDVLACELGRELVSTPGGCRKVLKYLAESIENAENHQDADRSYQLHKVINEFAEQHHFI